MSATLGFDVYGTLINTHGLVSELQKIIGTKAIEFSNMWREKQLEYAFRRGLMQNYQNFATCTAHALEYTCNYYKASITKEQKLGLLDSYQTLPAFDDVVEGLARLREANYRLFAFSNGTTAAVEKLLTAANIREFFIGVISVDDLKSFKPNPAVYNYFLRQSGSTGSVAWLISSNPFDVIGAIATGMRAAWLRRSPEAIFDPWGVEPTLTVGNLFELYEQLVANQS